MSYQIEWALPALRRFADEWDSLDWPHQREVLEALKRTDQILIQSPLSVGESRLMPELRILIEPPVTLRYIVHESLSMVRIVQAHAYWKTE